MRNTSGDGAPQASLMIGGYGRGMGAFTDRNGEAVIEGWTADAFRHSVSREGYASFFEDDRSDLLKGVTMLSVVIHTLQSEEPTRQSR